MNADLDALRRTEFPWAAAGDCVYLNHASTGPLPERARRAVDDFNDRRANPRRLNDDLLFTTLARSRELSARLIGAEVDEIALATNTGFGINLAAYALPLGPGDVVLTPDQEFPANVYPWMQAAKARGYVHRFTPSRDGIPDVEALERALDDPGVKALSVSWVAFASGYRLDLERLGALCRARGIYFVVDAIQGLGALPLDVKAASIDVLACGAQKWLLSPWGTGFAYVRRELVERMEPNIVSWLAVTAADNFATLTDYSLEWRPNARRFEQLTLPFQDFAGMNASLELFFDVGVAEAARRVEALADRIIAEVEGMSGVQLASPRAREERAGIVSLRVADPLKAAAKLRERNVIVSVREGLLRLSPHLYNTGEEIGVTLNMLNADYRR